MVPALASVNVSGPCQIGLSPRTMWQIRGSCSSTARRRLQCLCPRSPAHTAPVIDDRSAKDCLVPGACQSVVAEARREDLRRCVWNLKVGIDSTGSRSPCAGNQRNRRHRRKLRVADAPRLLVSFHRVCTSRAPRCIRSLRVAKAMDDPNRRSVATRNSTPPIR